MKSYVKSAVLITLSASLAGCLLILNACKKEEIITPKTQINAPFNLQSFDFGDTIWVEGKIVHPNPTGANVAIVNDKFIAVEPLVKLNPSKNSFSFRTYLVIENKEIKTGKHFVRVQVAAHGDTWNSFKEIRLGELVKQRLAIMVATSENAQRSMFRIDSDGQNLVHSSFGDAAGMATNGLNESLFLMPKSIGDARMFDTKTNTEFWLSPVPGTGSTQTAIFDVYSDNDRFYACHYDGRVVVYSPKGGLLQTYNLPQSFVPKDVLVFENYLLVVAGSPPFLKHSVFYFQKNTGAILRQIELPENFAPIDLCAIAEDRFVAFYNKQNGEAGWKCFTLNGTPYYLKSIDQYELLCATQAGSGVVILGTTNGVIRYNDANLKFEKISNVPAKTLLFDSVNSELLLGTESALSVWKYPQMQNLQSFSFSSEIVGVAVLYNK